MFTVSVQLKIGRKSAVAAGPRRALWELRRLRDEYRVDPTVSDGKRTYTELELQAMLDTPRR